MKKYTNTSQEMRFVEFVDGDAQFLFRGQSFESSKEARVIQKGIHVSDIQVVSKQSKKSSVHD